MLKYNEIYNMDNVEGMKMLASECVDLVVTSPPYDDLRNYNGFTFNFKAVANELYRVVKRGGVVVWVVGDATIKGNETGTSFKQALYFKEIGFNLFDTMIYEKASGAPPHPNRYLNAFEYMFVLSKEVPKTINILKDRPNSCAGQTNWGERTQREKDGSLTQKGKSVVPEYGVRTNIWRYLTGRGFITKDEIAHKHPAIFPEKLVRDHIISWSNEGDLVLDPFMGSGTTAKIARSLGRNYIGFEISKEYCEIAEQRLQETKTLFDL